MKLHYTIYGVSGIPVYEVYMPHVDSVWTNKREVMVLHQSGILETLPFTDKVYELEVFA